ncbi:MAG: ATP cone domain-containing protein [Candidatus Paceibacterota bacterium]
MVNIIKADGSIEPFKEEKLQNSLRKAGASDSEVTSVLSRVEKELRENISTEEIYRKAFAYLREEEVPAAARYSLRRALFGLGPTGFPFEDFLARIFEEEGYTVSTGTVIEGNCVPHEIDIAAYKEDHSFVAEAKFHARPGIKSDLQVALYCQARKLDLESRKICEADVCGISEFMIITNTKFTSMAKQYANCAGLSLLSWEYPKEHNLHDRIRATGHYPITVLQSLSNAQKQALVSRNIIVCNDLVKRPQVLRHVHLSERKVEAVLSEARQLCQIL